VAERSTNRRAANAHKLIADGCADQYADDAYRANHVGGHAHKPVANRRAADAHRAARCIARPTPRRRRNAHADKPTDNR